MLDAHPEPAKTGSLPFGHTPNFGPLSSRGHRLACALDRVRDRFGEQIIAYGRTSLADHP